MSHRLFLDPFDSFLIRDGRPFNQDDAGRAKAASVFPPPPDTLYGAARVALARSHGWDGTGDWSGVVPAEMFGRWGDPGTLATAGPFFSADGRDLLLIPAHVYARVDKASGKVAEIVSLQVSSGSIESDARGMRLLALPPPDTALSDVPLAGRFGYAEAVLQILAGRPVAADALGVPKTASLRSLPPEDGPNRLPGWGVGDLAATEPRIGIARDTDTRQVVDGMLYAAMRQRLAQGVRLYVEVDGARPGAAGLPAGVNFGGEGRFVNPCWNEAGSILSNATIPKSESFLIYLATPALMRPSSPNAAIWERLVPPASGISVVAAALPRVATQAGFVQASAGKRRAQTSARAVVPAGAVLFVAGDPKCLPSRLGAADSDGTLDASGPQVRHMGYGRYLTGVWSDG